MDRIKLETSADLEKFSKGLAAHFTKSASMHTQIASYHQEMQKAHTAQAGFCKSKCDSMDDSDDMKAFMSKCNEQHTAEAAHHGNLQKVHSELAANNKELADTVDDSIKIVPSKTEKTEKTEDEKEKIETKTESKGVAAMLETTSNALVAKALQTLETSDEIADHIKKIVLQQVEATLGKTLEPTNVSGVIPEIRPGITAVPRGGSVVNTEKVPAEFQDLVSVDSGLD